MFFKVMLLAPMLNTRELDFASNVDISLPVPPLFGLIEPSIVISSLLENHPPATEISLPDPVNM